MTVTESRFKSPLGALDQGLGEGTAIRCYFLKICHPHERLFLKNESLQKLAQNMHKPQRISATASTHMPATQHKKEKSSFEVTFVPSPQGADCSPAIGG